MALDLMAALRGIASTARVTLPRGARQAGAARGRARKRDVPPPGGRPPRAAAAAAPDANEALAARDAPLYPFPFVKARGRLQERRTAIRAAAVVAAAKSS